MPDVRPLLSLKPRDLVPSGEDRRVEIGVYDLLLPCRWFDIEYTVAELGAASPTLEFLLRLVRSVPGIAEDDARAFFGYARTELEYVLTEATSPGYVERKKGRLWLTSSGDGLFSPGEEGPMIFKVEKRTKSYGFDMLAVAPEKRRYLDEVEMGLPDLAPGDQAGTGSISERLPDKFRRFFRELGDRGDREQATRKDLYSVDAVVPGERYQVPVRLKLFAQASSPSNAEVDLSDWRPDPELSDRVEVQKSAGRFLSELRRPREAARDAEAYSILTSVVPEFLKEFTTNSGLSVERFWREAVTRAGEPRSDRKTVPLVGSLCLPENIEKYLRVTDYGLRSSPGPGFVLSAPPRIQHWGGTTLLRDLLAVLDLKFKQNGDDDNETASVCLHVGKPPRSVKHSFGTVDVLDTSDLPGSLEIFLVAGVSAAVLVHAPIGSSFGIPVALGVASFDPVVLERVHTLLVGSVCRHMTDLRRRSAVEDELAGKLPPETNRDTVEV